MGELGAKLGLGAIILIIALMGFIVKLLKHFDVKFLDVVKKNNKDDITNTVLLRKLNNPGSNSKPGYTAECKKHGDKALKVETQFKEFKETVMREIGEIKTHCTNTVQRLFDKLDEKTDKKT